MLLRGRVISGAIVVAVAMLACAALALGIVRFSCLAIDVTAGPEDIEASIVEVDAMKRGGDARKGGFSGEATEVDFAEVRGGVGQSALHRIELASTDGDEVEFFSACTAGDRVRIVFYPHTETLVTAEPLQGAFCAASCGGASIAVRPPARLLSSRTDLLLITKQAMRCPVFFYRMGASCC